MYLLIVSRTLTVKEITWYIVSKLNTGSYKHENRPRSHKTNILKETTMSVKLLINGIAGAGKTQLLKSLGKETFVVSRDAKEFNLPLPHMLVDTYYGMDILLYGGTVKNSENEDTVIEGVVDKLNTYYEKMGHPPENVVIDSVSQIFMDVIDSGAAVPDSWGSRGAFITKEMATLTKFIHEELELNGINVILLNHVINEKLEGNYTGNFLSFGQGKFLEKGGFYSTVNESVTIVPDGTHRIVHTRGDKKQARTFLTDLPSKMYVANIDDPDKSKKLKEGEEYFNLKDHIAKLLANQNDVEEWRI